MKRAWVLAGLALLAGTYALHSQQMLPPIQQSGMGCAYNTSPPTLTNGQAGWVQCDSTGKVITSSSSGLPSGAATAANQATEIASLATIATNTGSVLAGVSESHSAAAETNRVAKASAGSVISISGSAVSGSYIMLFDATSAPIDGAVTPKKCWGPMSSAGPFSLSWGIGPVLTMATGITVVSSSTGCFTKTATNAAFLSVEYQ